MIEIKNITKEFAGKRILTDANACFPSSSLTTITGPSGAGKTTLLRIISGLTKPDEGEVIIDSNPVANSKVNVPPFDRKIGFVFQSATLWPHMTVGQNVMFGMNCKHKNDKIQKFNEIAEMTKITSFINKYPHQISGGEAKRCAIARAIAPSFKHILMDEALGSLDKDLKKDMVHVIKDFCIKELSACVIYVTHNVDEIAQNSDRFFELKDGALKAYD